MTQFLSPEQAGNILDVSGYTVRRWAQRGAISYVKTPGGYYRIPRSEVDRLMTPIPAEGSAGDLPKDDQYSETTSSPMF